MIGTSHHGERDYDRDLDLEDAKRRLRVAAGKGPSRGRAGREPVTSVAKVEADRSRKNSRTKGNRAELEVAEMFSRWSGEVVRRTPQSGGWSSARFGVTADLVCANPAFPFHVEVKHREGWTLDDLVTGVRSSHDKSVVQWWKQCVESCPRRLGKPHRGHVRSRLEKDPLLVFRRNRQPWLVMVGGDRAVDAVSSFATFVIHEPFPMTLVSVCLLETFVDQTPVPCGLKNHQGCPRCP